MRETNTDKRGIWAKFKAPFTKHPSQNHSPSRNDRISFMPVYESVNEQHLGRQQPNTLSINHRPIEPILKPSSAFKEPLLDHPLVQYKVPIVIQPIDATRCYGTLDRAYNQRKQPAQLTINRLSIKQLSSIADVFRKRCLSGSSDLGASDSTALNHTRRESRRASCVPKQTVENVHLDVPIKTSKSRQTSASLPAINASLQPSSTSPKPALVTFSLSTCQEPTNTRQRRKSTDHTSQHRPRPSPQVIETSTIFVKDEPTTLTTPTGIPDASNHKVNQYHILQEIGRGAYGRVVLCRHEDTSRYFACKIISKSRLKKKFRWVSGDSLNLVKTEIAILKKVSRHRNINALVEVLEDVKEDNLYMSKSWVFGVIVVFELCEYGQIMKIEIGEKAQPFEEHQARIYFRDIVLGLEFMHSQKIVHRDVKVENILLGANGCVQISDFGISQMFNDDDDDPLLDNKNSSPLYSPPEICTPETKHFRGKAVDIWSLGVSLFCLLHGHCPFEDQNIMRLYEKIINDRVQFDQNVSKNAVDLLKRMLEKNPERRIGLDEIRVHPWVTNNGTTSMPSAAENCAVTDITEEEVENAYKPAFMFFNKVPLLYQHLQSKFMNKIMGKQKKPSMRKRASVDASVDLGSAGTVYSIHRTISVCDFKEAQRRHPLFREGIRYQRNGSSSTMPATSGFLNVGSIGGDVGRACIKDANWCTNEELPEDAEKVVRLSVNTGIKESERQRVASAVLDRRSSMQVIRE